MMPRGLGDRKQRFYCVFAALIVWSLCGGIATAQAPTGVPPFSSAAGTPDIVDLENLNVHINVPMLHRAGRGLNFDYDLSYDSSTWYPLGSAGSQTWQPVLNFGWRAQTEAVTGYISYSTGQIKCYDAPPGFYWVTTYSNFLYHDASGVVHAFPTGTLAGCSGFQESATATTLDGSGVTITATDNPSAFITTAAGITLNTPLQTGSGAASMIDTNGNETSVSATGTFTDTLGTTAMTVAGSGTAASPITYTYTSPSNTQVAYKSVYTNFTIQTKFSCGGVAEYGPTSSPLITEIDLPDIAVHSSDKYTFTYETTPGDAHNPHYVTGRLASVTLPTGGTITYTYMGGSSGITCADGSTSGLKRVTPDSATGWIYARTPGSGSLYTTTVTDPLGNQTVHNFSGLYETATAVYNGSISANPIESLLICYNNNFTNCTGATVTAPITKKDVYRYLPNLQYPGLSDTLYNSFGLLTSDTEFDYVAYSNGTPYVSVTTITYASLGNIKTAPAVTTVKDINANTISQTTNTYDQGTVTATSGTPQHVTVSGSRGNLTQTSMWVQGSTTLSRNFTYYDTGTVQTSKDVNGAITTYSYAGSSCGNTFPTSATEPLSLSRSYAWNCNGGLLNQITDENGNHTTTVYSDPYFWRPASTTDATGAMTNFTYASPNSVESALTFNSNSSTSDVLTTLDSLGRVHLQQTRQAPGSSSYDSIETDYDGVGRPSRVTLPYPGTAGQTNSTVKATTTTYDALSRPVTVADGGGGTIQYSYAQNDVLVTVGPAVAGENTKRRQLEYNALGWLTSVCELTANTGSGGCAQNTAQAGYGTTYTYDAGGKLLGVSQAAAQTRTYAYDGLGRLTSETNPESGTSTYVYDSNSTCGTSTGDLVKKTDAAGIVTCVAYDALHRVTSSSYSNSTNCKFFLYDTNPGVGWTEGNIKGRLSNAWIGNCSTGAPTTNDEAFNYSARGELTNIYQLSTTNGIWYNSAATYWPNGAVNTLQLFTCGTGCTGVGNQIAVTPVMTYKVDGGGRTNQVYASSGLNPVTNTTYNSASEPTAVTYGTADSDAFTYDPNSFRMTNYQFSVNTQTYTGALTWNPNGSLGSLSITDPFNSVDTQNCSYSHDDLSRIASVNCGAATWQQNFTYGPFGNIVKTVPVGSTGSSFQASYSNATNHITNISGFVPTYDGVGNVTNDGLHTYSWDARGNSTNIDGLLVTFDPLDRIVERNWQGAYTQVVYAPTGQKFAILSGLSLQKAFFPLPGQGTAVYGSSGLSYIRHADWLGSSRMASTPSRTIYSSNAYAPFGEPYVHSGNSDPSEASFTGQNSESTVGDYDFMAREYSNQGRWASPDPAGLAAVDLSNPQSWNRYAYVVNQSDTLTDPFGLEPSLNNCPYGYCISVTVWGGSLVNEVPSILGPWTPGGDQSGGGGGGSKGGGGGGDRISDTSARIQCATQFGRDHSLAAGVGAVFGDKVGNNFLTQLFLGNTVSSLAKIGTDLAGVTSPTGSQVAGMYVKGIAQGVPGLPGGIPVNGVVGPIRGAGVGAAISGGYNVIAGVGQETLELGLTAGKVATAAAPLASTTLQTAAAAVAWAKFGLDGLTFLYGLGVACHQ